MKTFTISIAVTIDNNEIYTVVQLSEPTCIKDFMQGIDAALKNTIETAIKSCKGKSVTAEEFSEIMLTTKKVNDLDIN